MSAQEVFGDDKYKYYLTGPYDTPEGGPPTKINNSGLVYVVNGEIYTPSSYSQSSDEKIWYQWNDKAYLAYLVTMTFTVPVSEEAPQGREVWTYLMGSDPTTPYDLFPDSIWRGYMVDNRLFKTHKVGIYLRYGDGSHEHGMMALAPYVSGQPETVDVRQFFNLPSDAPLISGPYPL